jgi:nucleoid-associated protein YgaU
MQQIERYGVIALVFLLVTIVAVSFWGDSKSPGFWSRLTGKAKKAEVAQSEPLAGSDTNVASNDSTGSGALRLSPAGTDTVSDGTGSTSGPNLPPNAGPFVSSGSIGTPPPAGPVAGGSSAPLPNNDPIPAGKIDAPAQGPTYVVKKGDTLGLIAARSLGSASRWTEISALNNNLEPKNLKIGATLALPATANLSKLTPTPKSPSATMPLSIPSSAPTAKPTPKTVPKSSGATYIVQKGDSLRSIAAKKLGDGARWKEISAANPGLNTNKLLVGKPINLPADAHASLVAAANVPSSASAFDAMDRPHVR